MLELECDLGAPWLLDLSELARTAGEAARIREGTVAKLLKRHRIRRFESNLGQPFTSMTRLT